MAKTSILTIMIQLAKRGDADRQTIKGLAELKSNLGLAVSAFAAFSGAAYAVGAALGKTITAYTDYAAQVRELTRLTGAGAEQTSRLIQAADDVTISYESLQKALWNASKNGVDVNVDSIAELADEYVALQSPTERATFLADNFGKSGAEMGKLLELGADGVRELTDAVSDNLVLTDQAVAQARVYEMQVDNLTDQWEAFKIQIGQDVVPPLNLLLTTINNNAEAGEWWKGVLYSIPLAGQAIMAKDLAAAYRENQQALGSAAELTGAWGDATEEAAAQAEAAAEAERLFKTELDQLKAIIGGDLGPAQDDLNAKLAEYNEQLANARTQKEKDEINANIAAETEAYNERAKAIMFNIQQEAILASGMDPTAQIQMINALAVAYGVYDESTAHAMVSNQNLAAQVAAGNMTWQEAVALMQANTEGMQAVSHAAQKTGQAELELASNTDRAGERAADTVGKFAMMEEAQAGLGEGIRSDSLPAVSSLRLQIGGMPADGRAWNYYFNIHTSGSVPRMPRGSVYDPARYEQEFFEMAGGGQLGQGWTIVGEEGFELVSPSGFVFPHDESKRLLGGGLQPEHALKYGSDEDPTLRGYYGSSVAAAQYRKSRRRRQTTSTSIAPPRRGGSGEPEAAAAAVAAEVVEPVALATESAAQAAAAAQQQQISEGIQTRQRIDANGKETADLLRENNELLRRQESNLTRAIASAVEQIKG